MSEPNDARTGYLGDLAVTPCLSPTGLYIGAGAKCTGSAFEAEVLAPERISPVASETPCWSCGETRKTRIRQRVVCRECLAPVPPHLAL